MDHFRARQLADRLQAFNDEVIHSEKLNAAVISL